MPKEEEEKKVKTAEEAPKSKKDLFRERMRKYRPDLQDDDEEGFYSALMEDYDRRDTDKENSDKLIGVFNQHPQVAQFILGLSKGENPFEQIVEMFGQDEFRAALDDPEVAKSLASKNAEYLAKQAKGKELAENRVENLKATLDAFDRAADAVGLEEEKRDDVFDKFISIMEDVVMNKVSEETFTMFLKGLQFDDSLASASEEAEIRGRNAKINKLKKKEEKVGKMIPTLGGQGRSAGERKSIDIGGPLGNIEHRKSAWDR